jgi:hypothetical protein
MLVDSCESLGHGLIAGEGGHRRLRRALQHFLQDALAGLDHSPVSSRVALAKLLGKEPLPLQRAGGNFHQARVDSRKALLEQSDERLVDGDRRPLPPEHVGLHPRCRAGS